MYRGVSVRIQNRFGARSWCPGALFAGLLCFGMLLAAAMQAQAQVPAVAPASFAPPTGPAPAPRSAEAEQSTYNIRLRDLERRVDDLKEQVFRSKARLNLLKETVLHGVIAGARAVIINRNEMSSIFQPIRIVYALDGAEIFAKSDDTGKLGEQKEMEIFNGSLLPGNHTLSVTIVYQGNGFGVFSYLKGYKYTVRKSNSFSVPEGKVTTLKVVGIEKGNALTTDPKDRPDLDFRSNVEADKLGAAKKAK